RERELAQDVSAGIERIGERDAALARQARAEELIEEGRGPRTFDQELRESRKIHDAGAVTHGVHFLACRDEPLAIAAKRQFRLRAGLLRVVPQRPLPAAAHPELGSRGRESRMQRRAAQRAARASLLERKGGGIFVL